MTGLRRLRARIERRLVSPALVHAGLWLLRTFWPIARFRDVVVVTRYRDVQEVLDRSDVFTVRRYGARMRASAGQFLLGLDEGAERERERGAAVRALAAVPSERAREAARHAAEEAIEQARKGGGDHIDLISDFGDRVAPRVIEAYFGLPDPGKRTLLEWVQLLSWSIFHPWPSDEDRERGIEAGRALRAHADSAVEARARAHERGAVGGETVLDRLLVELRGDVDATARTLVGLVTGSLGPPTGLFAGALDRLLDLRGGERERLHQAARAGDHATVEAFLLESARFAPVPGVIHRSCREDARLASGHLRSRSVVAGDTVLCVITSALRDGRSIRSPRRFWVDRPAEQRMLFGHGIHACIGRDVGVAMLVGMAEPLFALPELRRARGTEGRLRPGEIGRLPDQNYPRHLVARFARADSGAQALG